MTTTEEREKVAKHLGPLIRKRRKELGLTQSELGLAAGYTGKSAIVSISQVETGLTCPSLPRFFAIAEALGMEPHDLMNPKDSP